MLITFFCFALAIGGSVIVGMLVFRRRHVSHDATSSHSHGVVGYAWAVVPWIVVAIFLAQTVYNILTIH